MLQKSKWITAGYSDRDVCPSFQKKFTVGLTVEKAVLTITAIGLYEAHLNGTRVGDFIFAPGWTSYHHRLQYQQYDVTPLILSKEENLLSVFVGKGWAASPLGWEEGLNKENGNDRTALIASLYLSYSDGSTNLIVTDDSWETAKTGILSSEIYDGEMYDSNLGFYDFQPVQSYDYPLSTLIPQEGEWIREREHLPALQILHTPGGETVIDFGQNLTGYVQFTVQGMKGAVCRILHAETLDRDGNFYTENLRRAKQQITFTCNGTKQTYRPHFTFQGFRYIRLVDWPEEIQKENFCAVVVHSDMKRTGHFECSSPLLNQLYSNIIWGQKGNFVDVPTDCPQRDERLGWTGDAQVFVRAASYNFDVKKFFAKWLRDLKADQYDDGGVPAVIPSVIGDSCASSSAWGDAAVIVPWRLYLAYGDRSILEEQFDSMKLWIEYIRQQGDNEFLWNTGHHYGDWLGLDSREGDYTGATDTSLIATAFYAYSTSLLIKAGRVLEKNMEDYEVLYQNIVSAFQKSYLQDGILLCQTQTAHVLVLSFQLCQQEARKGLVQNLVHMIRANNNRLTTGFVGTPYLLHTLSENGEAQLAYTLLLQEEFPSWLYSVNKGATTIWEHWDGIRPDGTMWSADMNSFNHYAYGAVADWMYGAAAGIQYDERNPGFRHIHFVPCFDSRLDYVRASIDTAYGIIHAGWIHEKGRTIYTVTVPEGCTADISLDSGFYQVTAGTHTYSI